MIKQEVNEKVAISILDDFEKMPDEEIANQFLSYRKPLAVFQHSSRPVTVSVNTAEVNWREEDIELLAKFYKASLPTLYSNIEFEKDAIKKINGKDAAIIKFSSSVEADKDDIMAGSAISKFTYIIYIIDNSRVYIFNFTCNSMDRDIFEYQFDKMADTIKIKK